MALPSRSPCATLLAMVLPWWAVAASATSPLRAAEEPSGVSEAVADEAPAPLVHQWSREGYNLWAEIRASLDQEAYADIAQLMRNAPLRVDRGLLVDLTDSDLLVSYPTFVCLLTGDYPQLRQAMQERFGPLAQLRLSVAAAEGDRDGVEAVADGFPGTEAAVTARRWLGDRDLAAGRFDDALRQFQQGLRGAEATMRKELAARARLAGAMLGRPVGEPVEDEVRLGQSLFSAAKFERLVAERLVFSREWPTIRAAGGLDDQSPIVPVPAAFRLRRFPDFGLPATRAGSARTRPHIDWTCEGLSAIQQGDLLIAVDGRCAGAIGASCGQKRWLQDFHRDYPYTPARSEAARPLVSGPALFLRHCGKTSQMLCCLELQRGRIVWTSDADRFVVSDPMMCSDRVLALTFAPRPLPGLKRSMSGWRGKATAAEPEPWQLRLTAFDPEQGDVVVDRALVDLLHFSRGVPPCRATAGGDRIVARVPGAVVCADLSGRVPWVRRQPWRVGEDDDQMPLPRVADGRVFVVVPRGEQVECLDLETGRRCWVRSTPTVRQIVGIAGGRLIVACQNGLAAFQLASGRLAWRTEFDQPVSNFLCGEPGGILFARYEQAGPRIWSLVLVWLDVETGKVAAERTVLDDIGLSRNSGPKTAPGPLLATSGRLLAGFRLQGTSQKTSELVELVPAAGPNRSDPPFPTSTEHHGD